jgi:hypothetical protein
MPYRKRDQNFNVSVIYLRHLNIKNERKIIKRHFANTAPGFILIFIFLLELTAQELKGEIKTNIDKKSWA